MEWKFYDAIDDLGTTYKLRDRMGKEISKGREISVCDGKYTFKEEDDGLICLRYGLPWREFIGDKAVHALFDLCWVCQEV